MEVILMVAVAKNDVIGNDNKLIWHLPNDLKRFKKLTMGSPLIMGRKTFESLPGILPGREHIVISRTQSFKGTTRANSLEQAIEIAKEKKYAKVFVVGGGEIYKYALENKQIDTLEITRLEKEFEGDTFFPEIDFSGWELVFEQKHEKDDKHLCGYIFSTFKRK